MKEGVTILPLKDRPDLLDACANMAGAQWGRATGYDAAAWRDELRDLLAQGCVVLVACGDAERAAQNALRRKLRRLFRFGKHANQATPTGGHAGRRTQQLAVLGMVTVIPHETPPQLRGTGPWVSALLVSKNARRNGIGRRLLQAACDSAKTSGTPYLYALTQIPDWFASHGWTQQGTATARGLPVTVMSITL